ncbi:UDP-N-acetylglucosamine 1-carboxyvinyltransferase [Allofustis seminis]|uniref:UDP-N-acetylglucosamine 1-carboxyvinyltransferase n=1 Tax=Allofustis seminis TaxID=166939 RepID=UPI00035FF219|nr:UDP-N-acetylglucosamine 1-carboxyvinyltransferase [Allofustis seminis]
MEEIIVRGGRMLQGTVEVEGAKNAALPILAAAILGESEITHLYNVPQLSDIYLMEEVLRYLNIHVDFNEEKKMMTIDATQPIQHETPFEFMSKMRASVVVMGPLLARTGRAKVAMPGGCAIGTRPIDLHLKGFEAMGAQIIQKNAYLEAIVPHLHGAEIYLDFPSVGATQNLMMAATLADGKTTIVNAAQEPEIVDLANYLNRMGARIIGAGTEKIRIYGVTSLKGRTHSIIPDRIEAGTFMVASALTQGDIIIRNGIVEHNAPLIAKLKEMGTLFIESEEGLRVLGPERLQPTDVKTMPHPGFPTDLQALMTIAQLAADGRSVMQETVFENRFMHLEQLRKMNATFTIDGNIAVIHGGNTLLGSHVASTDLRASAALILAGLIAKGSTHVTKLEHLDRGYFDFHHKLEALGADIKRVSDNQQKNIKELTKA